MAVAAARRQMVGYLFRRKEECTQVGGQPRRDADVRDHQFTEDGRAGELEVAGLGAAEGDGHIGRDGSRVERAAVGIQPAGDIDGDDCRGRVRS